MRWSLVAASLAPALVACGALLQSGSDDDPARAVDASAPESASSDAVADSTDGAGPSSPSCPPNALICDFFDDGLAAWTDATSPFAIASEADRGNFATATFPASTGTRVMRRDVPGSPAKLRFSFSLRVQDPGYTTQAVNANYAVASVEFVPPAPGLVVALYLNKGNSAGVADVQLTGASTYEAFKPGPHAELSYGAWHAVAIDVELGESGSFSFVIDDATKASTPLRSTVGPLSIALGSRRPNSAPPAVEAHWDDVIVEPR